MVVMAKATITARVIDVPPVKMGSRMEAVKQNLDFWRTNPNRLPNNQKRPRLVDLKLRTIPTTTIRISNKNP